MENPELYYAAGTYGSILMMQVVISMLFVYFIRPFLREKRHARMVGGVYYLTILLLYVISYVISGFLAYGLGCLAAFFLMYGLERENIWQKMYLAAVFFSFRWLIAKIASCLSANLYHYVFLLPYTTGDRWIDWWKLMGVFLAENLICMVCLDFTVGMFHRVYIDKRARMSKGELVIMLCPCLSVVLCYQLLLYNSEAYESATGQSSYDWYGGYQWLMVLYCVASAAAILVMTAVFQKMKAGIREQKQAEQLQGQIEEMKRHIREVETLYDDMRSMKHDMKNHLMALEGLYEKGAYEEAGRYVAELQNKSQEVPSGLHSGNPVADVILREKKRLAEGYGISFQCQFYYPEHTEVNAFDISVILNNALDNAIEASRAYESPVISLVSHCRKKAYLIEIDNTFEGSIVWDRERGLPVTTKPEEGHGIGLSNIQRVAEKYHGTVDITYGDGHFGLTVLLMLA